MDIFIVREFFHDLYKEFVQPHALVASVLFFLFQLFISQGITIVYVFIVNYNIVNGIRFSCVYKLNQMCIFMSF